MRRRHRPRDSSSFLSLDSFMDIVTNVIGALFFVIIYVVLASIGATGKVDTLIITPGHTKPIFFECRGNTVLFPDIEGLMDESGKLGSEVSNSFYTYSLGYSRSTGPVALFEPVPDSLGETAEEFEKEDSVFHRELAKLDPEKHHVFFVVRNDSFAVFHAARREVIESGLRAGWTPMKTGISLMFSSGGGGVDPRDRF